MATEAAPTPAARRRKLRWVLIAVSALVLIYTLTGFLVVPWVIESYGARRLGEILQRPVRIAEAAFNPYAFTLRIKGMAIDETDGQPLIRIQELFTDLAVIDSIGGTPTVARLDLVGPEVYLTRLADGTVNLAHLGPQAQDRPAPEKEKAPDGKTDFKLVDFTLTQGQVVFRDESAEGFQTTLSPITATLANLTTAPDQRAAYTLKLTTEAGETLTVDGGLTLSELGAEGRLVLSGVLLAKYAPYYRGYVGFQKADGRLDLDLAFRYGDGQVRLDPVSAALSDLALADPRSAETLVALSQLKVDGTRVDTATRTVTVAQVGIEGLALNTHRDAEGRIDLVDLFAPPAAKPSSQKVESPGTKPESETVAAPEPGPQATPSAPAPPAEQGTPTPEPPPAPDGAATAAQPWTATIEGINLAAGPMRFADAAGIEPSKVSLETLNLQLGPLTAGGQDVQIAGLAVEMQNLILKDGTGDRTLVEMPRLALRDTAVDAQKRTVQAGRLEIAGTRINARRLADGRIDLAGLFRPPAAAAAPAPAEPAAGNDSPWVLSLDTLALADHGLRFEDRVPKPAATLTVEDLAIQVEQFSTAADAAPRIQLSGRINQKGTFSIGGPATLTPLTAELAVKLAALDISPFQPYFQDQVQMLVKDGQIGAQGKLSLALPAGGPAKIRYQGNASVSRLAAVDKREQREFLGWQNLFVEGADITTEPLGVHLERVALSDYTARVIIYPDGTLNLAQVFQPPAGPATPAPAPASGAGAGQPVPIQINAITLQGGRVDFSDFLTRPNFETRMVKLGGRVTGLSSQPAQHAEVLIQGALENQSPLEIAGRINPLSQEKYTDLKLTFRNIELSPFSPYSGKYIGYTLDKGKLTLELDYEIAERRLKAQNRIFFDALTLGERVQSPDATSLPVKLALALLTDRQGRIELDVPVQGNLDDPHFSIFHIVIKALANLFTKIVTAPFDALASAFKGQIVTHVGFAAASADLDDEARSQVTKLADVLFQRPALRIEIQATADAASDGAAIRKERFSQLLRTAKHNALQAAGQSALPPEEIRVEAAEKDIYVALAYATADFPKPRDGAGKEKILPPAEMEKLLYTQIQVDENDLRRLANARAAAVRDQLLADERLKAEHIFTVQPQVLEKAEDEASARQVRFNLK